MAMPTLTEYQDAIQNPHSCFSHPDLKNCVPELNKIGLPRPFSGSFAVVFPMRTSGTKWAVRCFSTYHQDQALRYDRISRYLKQCCLPCMVDFEFLNQGIKVRGKWYPILKMEWVEGESLNRFIEKNRDKPNEIRLLPDKFLQLFSDLRRCQIAHGDLQHGNIMIVNGNIRLVDYDGMFVPGLEGMPSNELGHRNYQHPSRTSNDFGPYLDNFSAWSIYLGLVAIGSDGGLLRGVNGADDHLVFRREDIDNPACSTVLCSLERSADASVKSLLAFFRTLIYCPDISQIPALDAGNLKPLTEVPAGVPRGKPTTPSDFSWVIDHLKIPKIEEPAPSLMERALAKAFIIIGVILLVAWISNRMAIGITGPTLSFVVTCFIFTIVLNTRFRARPEMAEKAKLSEERSNLKSEAIKIRANLNKLSSERDKLVQERDNKANEISLKKQTSYQTEKNEFANIDKGLKDTLSRISAERRRITQLEAEEMQKALERVQAQFLTDRLSKFSLSTQRITGIGEEMKRRLTASGINTAADISSIQVVAQGYGSHSHEVAYIIVPNRRKIHVDGIGPKKAQSLLAWRQSLESHLKGYIPKSLDTAQANAIRARYLAQSQSLDLQEANARKTANQAKSTIPEKYRKERAELDRQLTESQKSYAKKIKELDDKIALELKMEGEKNWSIGRLELRLRGYEKITFSRYLKRTLL